MFTLKVIFISKLITKLVKFNFLNLVKSDYIKVLRIKGMNFNYTTRDFQFL